MPPDHELTAIESALKALSPARHPVDRDRIMFAAGRASVRPASPYPSRWVGLAASLALVAVVEGAMLGLRPRPTVVERVVVVRQPAAPAVIAATPPPPTVDFGLGLTAHDRLAGQLLRYGLDGLSMPAAFPADGPGRRPIGARQMLLEELDEPKTGDPS